MIGDMFSGENYGLISIDLDNKSYKIELKDIDGKIVRSQLISL